MIHLSWRYFEQSGDPESYLLYRELSEVNRKEDTPVSSTGISLTEHEADVHDSQNDRSGDTSD